MKKIFLTILAAAAVFAGCKKENISGNGTGALKLNLSQDNEGYVVPRTGVSSKASALSLTEEELGMFDITVRKKGAETSRSWKYADIPSVIELSAGEYEITASSGNKAPAAFEQPVWEGKKNIFIMVDKTSTIDIECTLANMKVSLKPTEQFKNELSDYTVKVESMNTPDAFLIWKKEDVDAGKAGYFEVAPLKVTVTGYRWADENKEDKVSFYKEINEVNPRDHHILNLDAKVTGQVNGITITVDGSLNDVEENVEIPGLEETPVPGGGDEGGTEEPETPAEPSLEWPANPDFAPMDIQGGMSVDLVVKAPGKIKTFIVKVQGDQEFIDIINGMGAINGEMDLIGNATLVDQLGGMLPTGDKLLGQTSVDFSLSTLVPLIATVGAPGDYLFTLEVSDENGKEMSMTLIFRNPEK